MYIRYHIAGALDNEGTPPVAALSRRRDVRSQGEGSVAMAGNSSSASGGGGEGSAPVLPRATSVSGSPAFGTDLNGRVRETGRGSGGGEDVFVARLK